MPGPSHLKRGWCPTLDRPMQSGDGLLVRVQPRHATLHPDQAQALAEAAAACGNGILELTQRGNIQVRGLRAETVDRFAAAMERAGIPAPGPLLPPPLLGIDPGIDPRTPALVAALEHAFATDPRLAALPGKFAVAVDGGGLLGGRPVAADLVAHPDGRLVPASHGDTPTPAGPLERPSPLGRGLGEGTRQAPPYAVAPPFAQFSATMLHDIAALAAQNATEIRVTPWRAFVLAAFPGQVRDPGWITAPDDPRLLVTACVGAPGCARGTTPTRRDAARLRPRVPVHVAGCLKGCAHPGPAALTLVGRDGRYDLVRDGRATDIPALSGLTLEDILNHA